MDCEQQTVHCCCHGPLCPSGLPWWLSRVGRSARSLASLGGQVRPGSWLFDIYWCRLHCHIWVIMGEFGDGPVGVTRPGPHTQDLRVAVAMTGGVSLAVWKLAAFSGGDAGCP